MAFKNKFVCESLDCKIGKKNEENGDFMGRLANHPLLQLLNLKRKSRNAQNDANRNCANSNKSRFYVSFPSPAVDQKQRVCAHRPCPRHPNGHSSSYRGRSGPKHMHPQRLRPIGLSKSDDEILSRASDSPEEEDYLEDYREGQQARDLACDIHSLHISSQRPFARVFNDKSRGVRSSCRYSAHFVLNNKDCDFVQHVSSRPLSSTLNKLGCSRVQPEPISQTVQDDVTKSHIFPRRKDLQLLDIKTPPGSDPLPMKFVKKNPNVEDDPSRWFTPIGQKESKEIVNKSLYRRSTPSAHKGFSSQSSSSSLNDSMVVLVDSGSHRDIQTLKDCLQSPSINVKYSSADSIITGSALSSMESLRSSMSDGSKSSASNDSAISRFKSSSIGSECGLVLKPFLNLNQPHRSLIHSAKFQILSPISDKSQETSLDASGGHSQKTSPQEYVELGCLSSLKKTPSQVSRNIQDDFRNVHHIVPEPLKKDQNKLGSDSGISTEYKNASFSKESQMLPASLNDLPFDMPKLRRKLAVVKPSVSSSNSSISSGVQSNDANIRFSLPPNLILNNSGSPLHPTISKLQTSSGVSQSSSSNSSDWDVRSSAESSSDQGTPKLSSKTSSGRQSLALALGCSAMSVKGEIVNVDVPLAKQSWYHGALNREEAEGLLKGQQEGSYLVRSLASPKHDYSLSLKSARGFMHMRLRFDYANGCYTIGRFEKLFPSVPHVVSHFSIYRIPIKGAEHMVLLHPVHSETL